MTNAKHPNDLLPHLFRLEYSKMTAVLCRHFGLKHMEIAEDIASDTFLKASEHWVIHGIPENPTAWLYTVAKNKATDYFRRLTLFDKQIKRELQTSLPAPETELEFGSQQLEDSQLAMMFAVANPSHSIKAQISLALQILCGFSVEEIANAFLDKTETIKKCLQRARTQLREEHFQIKNLNEPDINSRLDAVLKTLYLLFNEGYFSKTNDLSIRRDLCAEALRLTLLLTNNTWTNTPQTNALLSLMCYQSSRLEARTNEKGEAILFEEQDRTLWDTELISRGNYYLVESYRGGCISKYHLEASIAYWHSSSAEQDKWPHILQLYDQLSLLEYSPITAMNRLFAYAKVHGPENALPEALQLQLPESNYYHAFLGYLYSGIQNDLAKQHYQKAIDLSKSTAEKLTLQKKISTLEANKYI